MKVLGKNEMKKIMGGGVPKDPVGTVCSTDCPSGCVATINCNGLCNAYDGYGVTCNQSDGGVTFISCS